MEEVKCSLCKSKADFYDAYMCVRALEERKVNPTAAGTKVTTIKQEVPYKAELLGICRKCAEKDRLRNSRPSKGLLIFLGIMSAICIGMIFYIYPQTKADIGTFIGVCVVFGGLTALWIGLAIRNIVKTRRNMRMSSEEYFEQNKAYLASLRGPHSIEENGHTYRVFYVRLHDDGVKYTGDDKVMESVINFGKSVSRLTPENKIAAAERQLSDLAVH